MYQKRSILGLVTSDTLIKNLDANAIENIENGITIINKERQPRYSTITPDSVGPIVGANMITNPTIPMSFPRLKGGKSAKIH